MTCDTGIDGQGCEQSEGGGAGAHQLVRRAVKFPWS